MDHFDSISDESIKQFLVSFAEKELQPDLSVRKAADRVAFQVFSNHRCGVTETRQKSIACLHRDARPSVCVSNCLADAGIASVMSPATPSLTPRRTRARLLGSL